MCSVKLIPKLKNANLTLTSTLIHVLDAKALLKGWMERCDSQTKIDDRQLFFTHFSPDHKCSSDGDVAGDDHAHMLLVYGMLGACSIMPDREWDYYFTYSDGPEPQRACNLEALQIMMPLHVACCGETLVYNDAALAPVTPWTRLERKIAGWTTISPEFIYTSPGYPDVLSEPELHQIAAKSPATYFVQGNKLTMKLLDPCEGLNEAYGGHKVSELIERVSNTYTGRPRMNSFMGAAQDAIAQRCSQNGQESLVVHDQNDIIVMDTQHCVGNGDMLPAGTPTSNMTSIHQSLFAEGPEESPEIPTA